MRGDENVSLWERLRLPDKALVTVLFLAAVGHLAEWGLGASFEHLWMGAGAVVLLVVAVNVLSRDS